jgi:shikimate dehydrogenase
VSAASVTGATRVFALLGDPVAHSLSPVLQNAAFRAADVDGVYVALRCDSAALPGLMDALGRAGGGGNVTLPHKEQAARVVAHPTEAVVRTGACNTFWLEDGRVRGDNTDVAGFRAAVDALLGAPPAGANVLLLGAGGAARAGLWSLLAAGASVTIANRSADRARALQARFDPDGRRVRTAAPADADGRGFDVVVNATSLGLRDTDPLPLDPDRLAGAGAVLDLVYRPAGTELVRAAKRRGIRAADGTVMLLHQGAAAFERWWRRPAPVDAMRAALARTGAGTVTGV